MCVELCVAPLDTPRWSFTTVRGLLLLLGIAMGGDLSITACT